MPAELASPQAQPSANDSSEEEWETVGDEGSMDQPSPRGPDGASKGAKNWRERASHRQKYWSRMTGFQFGRKLGDWGKDEDPDAKPKKVSKRLCTNFTCKFREYMKISIYARYITQTLFCTVEPQWPS